MVSDDWSFEVNFQSTLSVEYYAGVLIKFIHCYELLLALGGHKSNTLKSLENRTFHPPQLSFKERAVCATIFCLIVLVCHTFCHSPLNQHWQNLRESASFGSIGDRGQTNGLFWLIY